LKQHIDKSISASIESIELDLRWCVVIYSQAHIFLNSCLSHLASNTASLKKMVILTTDNYLTRELTCYEFFRTTLAVDGNDTIQNQYPLQLINIAQINKLSVEVKVFSGDSVDPNCIRNLSSYIFPIGSY